MYARSEKSGEIAMELEPRQQPIQWKSVVEHRMRFRERRWLLQTGAADVLAGQWQCTTQAGRTLPSQGDMAGTAQVAAVLPGWWVDYDDEDEPGGLWDPDAP